MKLSLVTFCLITLLLLACSFGVEGKKKCKPGTRYNPKLKKCVKGKGKATGGTTAAGAGASEGAST
ncbi:hypothetical protein KR018_010127, partial [Drosophila ironensis]